MNAQSQSLVVAIYRRDPEANWNVNKVDVGSLINLLTEEPYYLANVGEKGDVKLEVQRTHEWELVVGLVLTGSALFLKGAITELGKRFGSWLADRVAKLGTTKDPEVRAPGLATVLVSPSDLHTAAEGISELLGKAAKKGIQVQLVVEPGH